MLRFRGHWCVARHSHLKYALHWASTLLDAMLCQVLTPQSETSPRWPVVTPLGGPIEIHEAPAARARLQLIIDGGQPCSGTLATQLHGSPGHRGSAVPTFQP